MEEGAKAYAQADIAVVPTAALKQADEALERAATRVKRHIGGARRDLQDIRQAQMNLRGITVETNEAQPQGGHSDDTDRDDE